MKKKLPSKWCVRVEENSHPLIVHEWRKNLPGRTGTGNWNNAGYINDDGFHSNYVQPGYMQITLQEFKILVLKEEPENYFYLIEFFKKLNIE